MVERFGKELLREGPSKERREKALRILARALEAVDPYNAVKAQMSLEGDLLRVGGRTYDLAQYRRILVVGGGKASAPMAQAVEEVLGERITGGLINVKYGYGAPMRIIEINEAGHPIPDERGVAGARRMVEMLRGADERDLVLCLISGGGSALLVLPSEGITLADKRALTDALLRSGATINEMNAVRKHISQLKGGGLARLAYPAPVISLMLSDVVGNPLDVIASGPTVPDTATFQDAYQVVAGRGLLEKIPAPIAERLRKGKEGLIPETPKEGDPLFARTYNLVVGSNEVAAEAALAEARRLGLNSLILSTFVEGEAREVAKAFAGIVKGMARFGYPVARPGCVVVGGETTVTVRGKGLGGRNQELALAAALALEGVPGAMVVACGTDGSDGPTDAAGAIAEGDTIGRARALGLDPREHLANNDSYHFFQALGDLIITGPTNTNVNDLTLLFAL